MIQVVLVDKNNKKIGLCEKIEAHQKGLLHRAFSVFIYNSNGEMLLQRRALCKYHAPGLWSNAVCSHPYDNEKLLSAAKRRLQEEMGFSCSLQKKGHIVYFAEVGNGLYEHEHDTIFTGMYNGEIIPNPDEVMEYAWISLSELQKDVLLHSSNYTPWFLKIIKQLDLFKK